MEFTIEELEGILGHAKELQEAEDYRDWNRFAFLASVIANVNRGKKGRTIKPQDFIGAPPWEKKKKPSN